jgi:hypothetical protein
MRKLAIVITLLLAGSAAACAFAPSSPLAPRLLPKNIARESVCRTGYSVVFDGGC